MSKFTQGDWRCDYDDNKYIFGANDEVIGELYFITDEETKANARLIVEAKNMYKLLHKVLKGMNDANKVFRRSVYIDIDPNEAIMWVNEDLCRDEIETLLKRIDGEQEV